MKTLISIGLLLSILATATNAQVKRKGILLKKNYLFEKGDTAELIGYRKHPKNKKDQYLITSRFGDDFIYSTRIELIDTNLNYWENIWFSHRGIDFKKYGWEKSKREKIEKSAMNYFDDIKSDKLIYEDELLYDYIYQIIKKIHPGKLIRPENKNLGMIIVKSNEKEFTTYDNGYIILTTRQLSHTTSEKELYKLLAECIARITLECDLRKMRYPYPDSSLRKKAKKISVDYMSKFGPKQTISDTMYINKISGLISYTAWQEYHLMNFDNSYKLANKLYKLQLATEKDHLLLSRLLRKTTNDNESSLKALGIIAKAKKLGLTNLIDLDKEAGLLYLRLNEKEKAKDSFIAYKNGLSELEKQGYDISRELTLVNQILYKNKMIDN